MELDHDYIEARIERLTQATEKLLESRRPASKATAVLGGANHDYADDERFGSFLKAAYLTRTEGWNPERGAILEEFRVKATLADSDANGAYLIPNNTVGQVVEIAKARNIYRQIMNVVPGVRGSAVDQPYELDDSSLQRAQLQGGEAVAYGSNKDTRDFTLGNATATLYPLARIIDVGAQFVRQSEGAAERLVRSKLGRAFGLGEAYYILNGTGTNQPKGILTSFTGAPAAYTTTLSSETRVATIGRAIGALEARAFQASAVVMSTTDFWEMATETLGSSGSGGWALNPADGASSSDLSTRLDVWGVPIFRDPNLTVGTALVADWRAMDLYFGDQFRIDVSTEAGNRWDRNVVGFRAEEEMAFNADAFVLVGMVQKVTGL